MRARDDPAFIDVQQRMRQTDAQRPVCAAFLQGLRPEELKKLVKELMEKIAMDEQARAGLGSLTSEELAKFTGLTLDDAAVSRSTSENGPCHFNMAGNGPMHMSTDDKQNQGELHASEESLAYFFRPYNELLAKLVRPLPGDTPARSRELLLWAFLLRAARLERLAS